MYQARGRRLLPVMTSFADVVRARWHALAEPDDPTSRLRYDAMREHFERRHGRIVAAHWSSREAAGVAICCRHLSYGRLQWSLHRSLGGLANTLVNVFEERFERLDGVPKASKRCQ